MRLVEAPDDVPLLAPMIERELIYRVLQSEHGAVLRQLARADSRLSQIQRAVKWIRAHKRGGGSGVALATITIRRSPQRPLGPCRERMWMTGTFPVVARERQ